MPLVAEFDTPLLPDDDAITNSLSGSYADAKRAALKVDAGPLKDVRKAFDQHMTRIDHWLHEVEKSDEERRREERERSEHEP